jgi:hypothetical protein
LSHSVLVGGENNNLRGFRQLEELMMFRNDIGKGCRSPRSPGVSGAIPRQCANTSNASGISASCIAALDLAANPLRRDNLLIRRAI